MMLAETYFGYPPKLDSYEFLSTGGDVSNDNLAGASSWDMSADGKNAATEFMFVVV